ncbi:MULTISPECIES: bifunctional TVP38/TMEM64 family protein/FAD-dependent oxidoreductase [Idiomarina]|uniref:FAD-dependent oxidoreductase n=2 Tax=Idiomarinaceae TaxID=267893 RepID=UPI000C591475|nr:MULTISPECIES: bifunctional TVP38/TMEM64 family protein/FAD-dependent oxidoreductase [Idiomarina]MAO67460.1 pyridine nucleotide-disulfide oxidoreductase [Idiomarina sp.]MBF80358.1 pyridine nucleotide-disulfide oxidoreductase [Idiomarina sp.]MBP57793.1 pyridine nucleotide-disulfide oxidoreductase [Idiomarina sp.]|tara:strand:- start:11096 stop:13237 length:2142 start_codon:yes stop_codon:yes gene_type:complete
MSLKKLLLLLVIVALFISAFAFDLTQYLSLDVLKEKQQQLNQLFADYPFTVFAVYFVIYVVTTALSLPGATILTLGTGAIFGLGWGLLLASFAASFGAFLAFLSARFILHDWVQEKFGDRLTAINRGMERDGAFYLLSLRLVPLFPFFVINLVMGLTKIKAWTFYWVSQVGMLLGTAVYVNAGTQLAQISSLGDVVSADLIGAFVLLGIFPLIAKAVLAFLKRRKAFKGYKKPKSFDNNLVVIGAGSAGLVSAYIASAVKAKVTLIEKHKMGGDCLNTGCVPSKALLHVAELAHNARNASRVGVSVGKVSVDFKQVMQQVQSVIKDIEPHDSVERYTKLGVNVEQGEARIVSPWEVDVTSNGETKRITTRSIIIATGAKPLVPSFEGLDKIDYLTSDTLWELEELPKRLLILGGGPIGCELSQAFQRLGSQVTQVEMADRLMGPEDNDTASLLSERLSAEGIDIKLNHKALRFEQHDGESVLIAEHDGQETQLPFEKVIIALGRQPNISGFGLEELGVQTNKTVSTNELLQTNFPNIYACGDVAGPYQFTHVASHQAWYASVNALFDPFKTFRADYSVIPWVTYTSPQVANVGLTEQQARKASKAYEVTEYDIGDLDRAIADDNAYGRVKVLTKPGKDELLGVNIVGPQAGELLAEYVLAMKHGIGLNKILGTIHSYPTLAEANKYVAGEWKRANAPQKLLAWVEKFHRWRRS